MNRTPPDLARRLDRLSVAAHRFHRYAHHPLCAEYEGEVLRLGQVRICRGCAMAALGAALGLAAGLASPALGLSWLGGLATAGAIWAMGLTLRHRPRAQGPPEGTPEAEALSLSHRIPPRRGKLFSRLLPCALLLFTLVQSLRLSAPAGWCLATLAVVLAGLCLIHYRRRGPERGPCATCPERFAMHRCRGVREILSRERAFQRLAGGLIAQRSSDQSGTMS